MLSTLLSNGSVWLAKNSSLEKGQCQASSKLTLGISPIDEELPINLSTGCFHEWTLQNKATSKGKNLWQPPFCVLLTVISHVVAHNPIFKNSIIAWVGDRCWLTPSFITSTLPLDTSCKILNKSIYLNPPTKAKRLWAAIEILRSHLASILVLDGSGFNFNSTRRLHLATTKATNLCLVMRPPWELNCHSVAQTRWRVSPLPSEKTNSKWCVELLRCKGIASPLTWAIYTDLISSSKKPHDTHDTYT